MSLRAKASFLTTQIMPRNLSTSIIGPRTLF